MREGKFRESNEKSYGDIRAGGINGDAALLLH